MEDTEHPFDPWADQSRVTTRRQLFKRVFNPLPKTAPTTKQAAGENQATVPRRTVLKGLVGLAAVLLTGKTLDRFFRRSSIVTPVGSASSSAYVQPNETIPLSPPPISPPPLQESPELPTNNLLESANEVLKLVPNTPQRIQAETFFTKTVLKQKQPDLIPQALKVAVGWENRANLLLAQYQLRREEKSKLQPLSPEKIQWATEQEMHPETLAVCLDAYPQALKLIGWAFNKDRRQFRPDLMYLINQNRLARDIDELAADDIMINPGGLAMLLRTESGWAVQLFSPLTEKYIIASLGLVNIGTKPALENVTPKEREADREALTKIIQTLKQQGLEYQIDNIVGSEGGAGDISGGAIAMQMRIQRVLTIMKTIIEYNKQAPEELKIDPNPFTPKSAAIYVWFFLAQGFEFPTKKGIEQRYGYLKGDENVIRDSLEAWNKDPNQVNKIYKAASNYWETFNPAQTLTQH